MKYIIYKDAYGYHGTDERNYNAQIQDRSVICDYTDFESAEDIKKYLEKYTYLNPANILIIEDNPLAATQPLRVCEHCLMAIESREGSQVTRKIYLDDDDPRICDWCEDEITDILYEIL